MADKGEIMELEIPGRVTKRWLKDFDLRTVPKLDTQTAPKLLEKAYGFINRNIRDFKKADMYSPALDRYYGDKEKLSVDQNWSLKQMQHEFQKAVMALRARTSTVKETRKYWAEEERRIFNTNRLKADQHLSEEQRKNYWKAYQEFMHQYVSYDSNRVQQVFAQMSFWRTRSYTAMDMLSALKEINYAHYEEVVAKMAEEAGEDNPFIQNPTKDKKLGNVSEV